MFRTVPLSTIRSFSLYTQQWFTSYRFADSLRAVSKPVCRMYSEKLLIMDRGTVRNISSFYSKNKFEKLVHLVGFIIKTYQDIRSRYG